MTAIDVLNDLKSRDVRLSARGDRLAWEAPAGVMTADLKAMLASRKADLLAVLEGDWNKAALVLIDREPDRDRRTDLRYQFEERAGILQYDGGLSRADAEREAYTGLAEGAGQ